MSFDYIEKKFKSADGKTLQLFEYRPEKKIISSIILVYEIFGVTKHIHKVAHSLSSKGFLVQIPDLYSRIEKNIVLEYNKKGFKKGIEFKEQLGWDLPVMDIVYCASVLKEEYPVNIMGFCYGGSLSWLASQRSFMFDKAVCYYGSSIPEFLEKSLNCPALLHLGKKDKGIPQKSVEKVKAFNKKYNENISIYEYDADHGFNCEDRVSYNKTAALLSMERSLNFLLEEK